MIITEPIIVFGSSHPTTLQVVRSIGRMNVPMFVLLLVHGTKDIIHTSKYVTNYKCVETVEEGVDFLKDVVVEGVKPYILTSGDTVALCLDYNKKYLESKYLLPGVNSLKSSLADLMKKDVMCELALKAGLNVPKSKVIHSASEISDLTYPILMKPLASVNGSKKDIRICRSIEDVKDYFSTTTLSSVLATQFIEKDYEVCLIGFSSDKHLVIPGAVKKIRHNPPIYGARSFAQLRKPESDYSVPYEKVKTLIELTGYKGLFSVELLIKDGNAWFVEINFRADGNMMLYTDGGCNIPYELSADYLDLSNKSLSLKSEPYVILLGDFDHVIKMKDVTLLQWLKDFWKSSSYIVFDKFDVRPFLIYFFPVYTKRVISRLKRIFR